MEREGVFPNTVTYNTAIRACGDSGALQEGLDLLYDMEENGVKRTVVTYGSAISACHKSCDWQMVRF